MEHDADVGLSERARGADVFQVAATQKLGAHETDESGPREQQQDEQQRPEARDQHRRDDEQHEQLGDRVPDFQHALEREVDPAAEVALHGAGADADDGGDQCQDDAEQHRDAEAVDDTRDDVATLIVEAEPVAVAERLIALQLFGGRIAQRRARRPLRRGRVAEAHATDALAARVVLVDGVVGVVDRRPDGPAVPGDLVDVDGIAVVGDGEEAAELRFRIIDRDREQELALVAHEDRPVVGEQLGEHRQHDEGREHDEAPVAAPVGLEVAPAALGDRRRPPAGPAFDGRTEARRRRGCRGGSCGVGCLDHRTRPPGFRSRCAGRRACRRSRR